jgi:hypothetical protein
MVDPSLQENRLRKFASFFKGYMGVMPVVTAAFAPLLTMLKAVPVFESQKSMLATYSGLLGFLLLGWVFYARGTLAKLMVSRPSLGLDAFGRAYISVMQWLLTILLPLTLIWLSLTNYLDYLKLLETSIVDARLSAHHLYTDIVSRHDVLEKWGQREPIVQATSLQYHYLGIFLYAELAFVVMALREYAYGVLKISETSILGGDKKIV